MFVPPATVGRRPLRLGSLEVWPPVVLAPMAGVTNAAFRTVCRRMGAGLFVSEMIGARALVDGDPKTAFLARFRPDEDPRSIQLYGTDPGAVGEAVHRLVGGEGADHIDLNFGCPAPKVTRHGGGAALPFRTGLFRRIVRAAVASAGPVPVTVKLRTGIDGAHLTYLAAGLVAREEGVAAVTLHARTAEQLYAGRADWQAISRLKQALGSTPVLGNGDIWEAADAIRMLRETGCDGVVVGRGCLGRPWLFRDLADAFAGRSVSRLPSLGEVVIAMRDHASLLVEHFGERRGMRSFRKHAGWYLKGYPVGPGIRRGMAEVDGLESLDGLTAAMDPEAGASEETLRMRRGHTSGPRPVRLPHRYLQGRSGTPLGAAEVAVSGG